MRRWTMRRTGITALAGATLVSVALLPANRVNARQEKTPLVRGNAPGEWRYWGADAWSTRYSPLDQINASNFGSLEVAWQWNASAFGSDEYYRTTPIYANGRLFTVATTRRVAAAIDPGSGETLWMWRLDEGIRWQKAPRQFAGRGLSYWTGPPGADPRIFAVDKATGKQIAAVKIPSRTSAVPMTFLHKGRQYIVFATGGGANTSLVALALPKARPTTQSNGS